MLQLTLSKDALFEHFKQSSNKLSQICQSKSYIAPPWFNKKGDGWPVQIYWKSRLIRPCVKLVGSSRNCLFRSTCIKRKMGRHAISQLLYLQIIMLILVTEYARYILSLHTAGLWYNNRWITVYTRLGMSVTTQGGSGRQYVTGSRRNIS